MSPFRVGKIQFIVAIMTLLTGGMVESYTINKRLKENAQIQIDSGIATRRVLEDILQRMGDNQQLVKDLKEMQVNQRAINVKVDELTKKLEAREAKLPH